MAEMDGGMRELARGMARSWRSEAILCGLRLTGNHAT